jgi:hypothetical protein
MMPQMSRHKKLGWMQFKSGAEATCAATAAVRIGSSVADENREIHGDRRKQK